MVGNFIYYIIVCTQNIRIPAKKPSKASQVIFFKYHIKLIFSIPITATPAADPIIIALCGT